MCVIYEWVEKRTRQLSVKPKLDFIISLKFHGAENKKKTCTVVVLFFRAFEDSVVLHPRAKASPPPVMWNRYIEVKKNSPSHVTDPEPRKKKLLIRKRSQPMTKICDFEPHFPFEI